MSTILGTTYDAHMSDYPGDLDVLMQAHSSDPWTTQEDGIMEDDNTFAMLTGKNPEGGMSMPATSDHQDEDIQIEVEMEDYEHHSEYEMLDESEVIVEDIAELQDVEVVDLQPSPETSLIMSAPPTLEPHGKEAQPVQTSPLPPPPTDIAPELPHEIIAVGESPVLVESVVVEESVDEPVPSVLPDGVVPQPENLDEATASDQATYGSHVGSAEGEHLDVQPHDLQVAATENKTTVPPDGPAAQENFVPDAEVTVPPEIPVIDHEVDDDPDIGHHVEVESNPHEIDDGVLIEPVPPVIVHSSFSEQPFVLFNRPMSSRSQSPSPDEDVPSDTVVLLHDRPTLYYGPLHELFSALREEEFMLQQPDIHHCELGLSIDSLQLSISEDNVHSREFSLFQLNNLHDSFHTGLLRIQLQQHVPRFIARYQELHEHLDRLGVHAHDDGLLTAVPSSTGDNITESIQPTEHEQQPTDVVHPEESGQDREVATDFVDHVPGSYHQHGEEQDHNEDQYIQQEAKEGVEEQQQGAVQGEAEDHGDAAAPHDDEGHTEVEEETNSAVIPPRDEDAYNVPHNEDSAEPSMGAARGAPEEVEHDAAAAEDGIPEGGNASAEDAQSEHEEAFELAEARREEVVEELEYVEDEEHQGEHDQLDEGEYGTEYDHAQAEADELQGTLDAVGSEYSGETSHEDDTQDIAGQEDLGQEYPDERPPSPGAEDELPPIDTEFLHTSETDNGEIVPSASTPQSNWQGEEFGLAADEAHESETLHSSSEEENENTENYNADNSLAYPDGGEEDAEWDQDLDGEGEADPIWDGEYTEQEEVYDNNNISIRSKRSFHEIDADDEGVNELVVTSDSKRSRIQ